MPVATETVVPAYAFCADGRCHGYEQEPVDGIRTTTETSNFDLAGPMAIAPGHTERSSITVRFANEEQDGTCASCGKPRHISEQVRPEYARNSGQAQDALLNLGRTESNVKDLQHARELDELKRDQEMKELRDQVAVLTQALSEKRGPGRPRKQPEED